MPPPGMLPPGGLPPGMPLPSGMPLPPGMPIPPPGMLPPGAIRPPFPPAPPNFVPARGSASPFPPVPPPSGSVTPAASVSAVSTPPPPAPASAPTNAPTLASAPAPAPTSVPTETKRELVLPVPSLSQTLPPFKKETDLKFKDPNFSPVSAHSVLTAVVFIFTYRRSTELAIRSTLFPNLLMLLSRAMSREGRSGRAQRTFCEECTRREPVGRPPPTTIRYDSFHPEACAVVGGFLVPYLLITLSIASRGEQYNL